MKNKNLQAGIFRFHQISTNNKNTYMYSAFSNVSRVYKIILDEKFCQCLLAYEKFKCVGWLFCLKIIQKTWLKFGNTLN